MLKKPRLTTSLVLCSALFAGGCYGPFNLTRNVHKWNGEIGEDWVNELVFLAFVIVPVYGISMLGDAIIFNTIGYWGDENPISDPYAGTSGDDEEAATLANAGVSFEFERVGSGEADVQLRILDQGTELARVDFVKTPEGTSVAKDADGKVLAIARTLADGSVVVLDSEGSELGRFQGP